MDKHGAYKVFFKRIMDIIFSFILIIIFTPLMLIIAIIIRLKLGKPILFKQKRHGQKEKIFTIIKFRSMKNEISNEGKVLSDAMRLTKFGNFLRSTSLDELPELWNVLVGDMSIIGPRPQLLKDFLFMSQKEKQRYKLKPGITGLAQVSGRNRISWEKKFEYDIFYINNVNFFLDIKIFFLTIIKVLFRKDINSDNMCTSEDLGDYLLRNNKISQEKFNEKIEQYELIKLGIKNEK